MGGPPDTLALHTHIIALSDLYQPLCRTECAAIPNWARFQHLPYRAISLIRTCIDGSLRLPPPLSFQSQITGNLAKYGFASSLFSPTPCPLVSGCILSLTCGRAHVRAYFSLVFRVVGIVTFLRTPEPMAASTAAATAGSNAIPTLAPSVLFL